MSRNYCGLKLACWLAYGSYWQDTLRPAQVINLIERTLNHPEVDARWPEVAEIEVEFPNKGAVAWALRKRGGNGIINLPTGTRSPLIVLHEVAHLLSTTKREPHHGPGFTAIHLMLVELMAPSALRPLLAAYHATGMKYDPSLIPEPNIDSNYVPIVTGAPLQDSLTHMRALLASGVLTPVERRRTETAIAKLKRKESKDHEPLMPLPSGIRLETAALLKCDTAEQIAAFVLAALRDDMMPSRMRKPKTKKPIAAARKR